MRHFRLDEGRDDGVECRGDRSRGFLRHGGQRARRRRAAEHVSHRGARPVSRQELAVPQIDAQRGGPRPVPHRRGHPVRGPALGECPAAAAFPLDQPVPGDLGPHRRDLGYLPPFHTPLRRPRQVRAASAAAGRLVPDNVIGMITQPHRRARLPLRAAGLASGLLPLSATCTSGCSAPDTVRQYGTSQRCRIRSWSSIPQPTRAWTVQMTVDHRPDLRQRPAEFQHPVELLPVAQLAPPVVVPVLAAARRVRADRLDVAV